MENYGYDLDVLSSKIKRTADLLSCFCEFCDEEGHFGKSKTFNEKAHKSIAFMERLDTFRSLVDVSALTLYEEYSAIEKALDKN